MAEGLKTQIQSAEYTGRVLPRGRKGGFSNTNPFQPFISAQETRAYGVDTQPQDPAQATSTAANRTFPSLDVGHADPIAPLRKRDAEELAAIFENDHIQDITLDIHRYLARTYPEPCWEDEPYEFLHGYI